MLAFINNKYYIRKHLELPRTMLLKVAICSKIRNLCCDVNQHPHFFEKFLLGKKKKKDGWI